MHKVTSKESFLGSYVLKQSVPETKLVYNKTIFYLLVKL